jgi:hypothetical protein
VTQADAILHVIDSADLRRKVSTKSSNSSAESAPLITASDRLNKMYQLDRWSVAADKAQGRDTCWKSAPGQARGCGTDQGNRQPGGGIVIPLEVIRALRHPPAAGPIEKQGQIERIEFTAEGIPVRGKDRLTLSQCLAEGGQPK